MQVEMQIYTTFEQERRSMKLPGEVLEACMEEAVSAKLWKCPSLTQQIGSFHTKASL